MGSGRFRPKPPFGICRRIGSARSAMRRPNAFWRSAVTEQAAVLAAAASLEEHFRLIHQNHMQDTPLCNEKIQVEAIGFRPHQEQILGIMVTPWFMNLVLAPLPGHDFPAGRMGDKRPLVLPVGPVDFNIGEVPGFGRLDICSLFSPMFDFQDHHAVQQTAQAVFTNLFAIPQPVRPEDKAVSRRALLRGKFGRSA